MISFENTIRRMGDVGNIAIGATSDDITASKQNSHATERRRVGSPRHVVGQPPPHRESYIVDEYDRSRALCLTTREGAAMGQPPNRPPDNTPSGYDWEDLRRLSINTVRKCTSSDDGAEDIAQEVLFKLWRTEHQENKRRGFVRRATKNLVIDRYRHRIRQPVSLGFDESHPGPEAYRAATVDARRFHRPDIIAELDSFLARHDPSAETFGQLFALSILSAQGPAADVSTPRTDSPPASTRAASSTLRRSARLRRLGEHFGKLGVSGSPRRPRRRSWMKGVSDG